MNISDAFAFPASRCMTQNEVTNILHEIIESGCGILSSNGLKIQLTSKGMEVAELYRRFGFLGKGEKNE